MAVLFNGSTTYTQDFNGLVSGTSTNNTWTNDTTLPGWSLFRQPASGTAISTYNAGTGNNITGNFYSYHTVASTDSALGGLGSGGSYFGSPSNGNVAGWIAFSATNTSGSTINSVNVAFDGEQWRNGGNTTPQQMVLEYGFGNTFASVSNWTAPGGNFNWTSPVATITGAAVDGNTAGLVASRGGTLNTLNWSNNSNLWVRWIENNDAGNDHGLAIDNFSLTAVSTGTTAVPEPSDLMGTIIAVLGVAIVKRKLSRKSVKL